LDDYTGEQRADTPKCEVDHLHVLFVINFNLPLSTGARVVNVELNKESRQHSS